MKNLVFNLRTAKAQAGCAKLKDTSLSFRRGLGRGFLFTFLLLTLGVGQMCGKVVYVDLTNQTSYNNGYAHIHVWTGSQDKYYSIGSPISGNLYQITIDDNPGGWRLCHWKNSSRQDDCNWISDNSKNLFTIANSGNTGTVGVYSLIKTVTYDGNGNGGGDEPTDDTEYAYGDEVTVAGNTGSLTKSGYVFAGWSTTANGSGVYYAPGETFTITTSTTLYAQWLDVNVLNGTKIMVYGGEPMNWTDNYKFRSEQNASKTVATANRVITDLSINSKSFWFGPVVITSGIYYQGHGDWAPNLKCAIDAGNAYCITNDSPGETYFKNETGGSGDQIYSVKTAGDYTPKNSFSAFSIDASVTEGNSITVSSTPAAGSAGKSVIGRNNYVQYYLYDGSSWSLISLSAGKADVSDLSAGSGYKIAAVLSDGCIYVATSESFEVESAVTEYSLTFGVANSPYNNGTLGVTVGGAAASSGSSYASGSSIACSATPSAHYKLAGWYSDASYSSKIDAAGTSNPYVFSLGANTSVYAKFVIKQCTITLTGNGSTAGAASVTATHGSTLPSFTAHSRDAYSLQGYFTSANGGTKIINADGSLVASTSYADASNKWDNDATTLTLYAQLTQTVTLNANTANHGYGDNTSATATYNGISSVSGFSATSAATGYQLEGYYSDPTSGVKVLNSNGTYASDNVTDYITSGKWTKSGATTLYAHLTAKTYSITLNANGGSSGGSATATYNSNKLTSITAPSKSGYDIMGYYKEPGCTNLIADASGNLQAGTTYTDASGNWTSNSSQTLYPKWGLQLPAALQLDGQLSGGWDNCKLMNKSDRLFSYTVYSVSAGTYEFCFKNGSCGSTALLKPNMSICNSKKNVGNITWEDAGGEYHNFRITTTSEGDVTITVEYGETTALVTVNHTSVPSISSGWYLRGDPFGGWNSDNNSYPFNRSYRGIDGVYYRVFDFAGQTDKWFKPCKGTNEYGQSTGADIDISENTQYLVVKDKSGDKTSFKPNGLHQVWCIIDENSNKFWVQSPDTYYTLSVTSDHGTVTLTENVYGNLQTNQFEAGETVNISVSAASGYWIDDIELNGTPLVTDRNSGSWSGSTTMPAGNATLTVTYNRYYTLTYDANYYTSGTGGTAPSASSYVSGSNVTVVGKGDLTMTNYTFSGWNTDPHITGTNYAEGANIEMTGNITLYGVWKRTIPFELEDADPEFVMATVYGTYNCTTLTDYDNPTKDGYTFGGWWTNIAGGDNYVISPEKELQPGVYHWTNYDNKTNEFMRNPTSISSLYAKWTQTVTLNPNLANHGSGDNTSATIVYKATGKTSITHCTPAAGYHLVGYYTAATDGVKVLNADGSFAGSSVTDYITEGKWTKAGATTLYAHYEGNTYTVTLAPNGGSGSNQTVTATYDAAMPPTLSGGGAIVAPSKTGYAFGGYWYESTQYYAANLSSVTNWNRTSATTLNAKWTPKQSALTFDYQTSAEGYGTSGSIAAVSATYGAAMPALTGNMPTAAQGYAFMGFYSETGGNGTKYYNADKSSAHNWDVDTESGTTLYAYYKKAEITAITLNQSIFEPVASGTSYVTANPTIEPTPAGDTEICWALLYDDENPVPAGHDADPYTEGGTKPNQVRFNLAGLAAGSYRIRATLRTGSSCDDDPTTLLSTYDKSVTIANEFTVTVKYMCGDVEIQASTTTPGKATQWTSISAPDVFGYTFSTWDLGDGGITKHSDDALTKQSGFRFKASYSGILTAKYTKKKLIFIDISQTFGTGKWDNPYVYFYKAAYWDKDKGTGESGDDCIWYGAMTQIGSTGIWYYDYSSVPATFNGTVAFTWGSGVGHDNFNGKEAIYRTDFSEGTPLFVPAVGQNAEQKTWSGGSNKYFNRGYWVNYIGEQTGYTLYIYNTSDDVNPIKKIPFTSADKRMTMKAKSDLEAGTTYKVEVYRDNGHYYKNNTARNYDNSQDNWKYLEEGSKGNLITTAAGDYVFTLSYTDYSNDKDFQVRMIVDYPANEGDFQVLYGDRDTWSLNSAHSATWRHPSRMITARAGGIDTISFFVPKEKTPASLFPTLYARKVTNASSMTWAALNIAGAASKSLSVDSSAVYNFKVTQSTAGVISSIENIGAYTGEYYIRCDAVNSKWDNYTTDDDHRMTYSSFSESSANAFGEKYSHYKAKWCKYGKNVKFVIANDYSPCISDTLVQDVPDTYGNINKDGFLKDDGTAEETENIYSANIRFMWNRKTNKISRAYVASSTNASRLFLVLRGNTAIKGLDDSPIEDEGSKIPSVILQDDQNWIYEEVLYIKPNTRFKLYACYAQVTASPNGAQYFRGTYNGNAFSGEDGKDSENSVVLIGGSGETYQKARVLYDFKTNRLICAWLPSSSAIDEKIGINADVMVIREHHEPAQYISFKDEDSKLTGVKTVYGVMKFNRWVLNNRKQTGTHGPLDVGDQKSIYERSLYFVSFPFDVRVGDIFGFGRYWDEWYLEYYDGLNRAKNGFWLDSPPNWKYVTPEMATDYVLKANVGYILGLDLDFMAYDNTTFWAHDIETIELFFPSTVAQETLQQVNCTIPALSAIEGDPYRCTINRGDGTEGDRRVKDSYWHCMGVPSFNIYNTSLKDESGTAITWQPSGNTLPFIYAWNKADNTLTAQSTNKFTFLPMHAYLVQNGGEIRWENVSAKGPSPIVARRVNEQPEKEYEWRLALMSDTNLIDQTYIKMSNLEQVTDTFDFNQDLIKEFNKTRSNIYSYIGYEQVAANSMPLQTEQTTVIPVGVKIKTAGDYTFAMPEGTMGVGITLIDTETGVRTSLGLMDYTVTLTAGSFNQRFFLEISPVSNTPTDIEQLDNGDWTLDKVRKVLIDNKLFIITEDGKVFDARGAMVK